MQKLQILQLGLRLAPPKTLLRKVQGQTPTRLLPVQDLDGNRTPGSNILRGKKPYGQGTKRSRRDAIGHAKGK